MSNTDSFIDEVSEEVRKDRLFGLFKKYGWIPAVLIVLLVGGAGVNEYFKSQKRASAEALGDAVLGALEAESAQTRAALLEEIGADTGHGQALVALIRSGQLAQDGNADEAAAALEALSADGEAPELYRDMARLKRLVLLGANMDTSERLSTIEALSAPGGAFRVLAQEQRAMVHVEMGEMEDAVEIFQNMILDAQATPDMVQRARQMIVVLGGTLDAAQ